MIHFRQATLNDIQGILQVMLDTNYIQFFKEPYISDLTVLLKNEIIFITLDESLVVAYAIFSRLKHSFRDAPMVIKDNFVSSEGIGVHSKYRGEGIAFKLKLFCESELKKLGVVGIYTDVASTNIASLQLQKKLGFELVIEYDSSHREAGVKNCVFKKYI